MQCSSCCRHESGFVFLSEKDVSVLLAHTRMDYADFVREYCRWVGEDGEERLSLMEKPNFDCIFWDRNCTVYQYRPLQCRTFPFWQSMVVSPGAWAAAARDCPGINRGAVHSREEIESCLAGREDETIITRTITGEKRYVH
jgi:Fe-S-cluster containining protein